MTKETVIIGDVEPFSIVDFPNHIAAVAFLQGCPWRCPFCYNLSLQRIGGQPESNWTFEKFTAFLQKRKNVLDAVVFSGGDPLVHDGLSDAVDAVKKLGYTVGLHTGGYRPEALARIVEKLDWVGLDIKAPFDAEHYARATGGYRLVDNIKKSLEILLESKINFECRTTCDPRILSVDDIYKIAGTLKDCGVKAYYIQKYRPVPNDTTTTDEMCSALIGDQMLIKYLKQCFEIFDVRK